MFPVERRLTSGELSMCQDVRKVIRDFVSVEIDQMINKSLDDSVQDCSVTTTKKHSLSKQEDKDNFSTRLIRETDEINYEKEV